MNNRLIGMARKALLGFCATMFCGGFVACTDDYDLDDPDNYPSWLGGSIYDAMKSPENLKNVNGNVLTGTFKNYLRLIDDLGYTETLSKTGSKTVFPANDEAFDRFYANNSWGVKKYEDLTEAMKKQLLYASMLDNALLVEMLSNISDGQTAVVPGQAMKHTTGANVIDSITWLKNRESMPVNNPYWEKYYDKGIHIVMDATRPMMVHFTEEQMTGNNITTRGENSDFEVVTGTAYNTEEKSAYIYRNKIISPDVTCKNGYIHQMQDVLVPPGNLAELIRTNGESNLFSRMLDRFSAPYYDATTTKNYNDYAQINNLPLIDSIYQKRYMSQRSQSGALTTDPNRTEFQYVLPFDPGWNNYNNGTNDNAIKDIAVMFVPTDKAMKEYFLPGGGGEFLINAFGKKPNTEENLEENIDSIPLQNVQQLIGNLMKSSFVGTVPSKFNRVMDEANDPMGLSLDVLNKTPEGTYDVKIANNGVAYMLNKVFAPPSLIAVSAPVTLSSNMRIMNEAVNDGKTRTTLALSQNYYAYLLAMSANYAFFIPTDDAFGRFYVDPASLATTQPRALKFYYQDKSPYVYCSAWKYDVATGTVGTTPADFIGRVSTDQFRSQFIDILNYHTIVLKDGETLGTNKYYKTKHGGTIVFDGQTVVSGGQLEGKAEPSQITQVYHQANGEAYAIDHVIQPPLRSVLNVLESDPRFSEFTGLCTDFDMDSVMEFASDRMTEKNEVTKKPRMDAYHTFAAKGGLTDNVNYLNSYNYTVYAPDNEAMQKAYGQGLPKWSDIKAIADRWAPLRDALAQRMGKAELSWKEAVQGGAFDADKEAFQADRDKALAMVEEINSFIRYHFQDNSVYADNVVEAGVYPTACSDTLGIREKLTVSGGNGRLLVKDKRGQQIVIEATNSSKLANEQARDYVINNGRAISTSSFSIVHQISTPLNIHADTDRYDGLWTGSGARSRLKAYRKQYDTYLYKRYDRQN